MKKILKSLSAIVVGLTLLSLFSYAVRDVAKGQDRLGPFTKPLDAFSRLPFIVKTVVTSPELRGMYPTCVPKDTSFHPINKVSEDTYGLHSYYGEKQWNIVLYNFKDDSTIHSWTLDKENFVKKTDYKFENSRPKNPILLANRSLITIQSRSYNLYRLDRDSKIIWQNNDRFFHHSLNRSIDGNIWACTTVPRYFSHTADRKKVYFRDEYLTKVRIEDGKILDEISVADMLIDNGYKYMVYGYCNEDMVGEDDPLHLNDIEPVFENGPYWKKGDLFLSLRHRSLIIQYRPSNNRIVRLIQGPFLNQHDVDIYSDHEIAIFDNNTTNLGMPSETDEPNTEIREELVTSGIVIFDFADSTYRNDLAEQFEEEEIYTRLEGLYHYLSNGNLFVESTSDAKVYILNSEGLVMRKQFETPWEDLVYRTNWIRIYEDIDF